MKQAKGTKSRLALNRAKNASESDEDSCWYAIPLPVAADHVVLRETGYDRPFTLHS